MTLENLRCASPRFTISRLGPPISVPHPSRPFHSLNPTFRVRTSLPSFAPCIIHGLRSPFNLGEYADSLGLSRWFEIVRTNLHIRLSTHVLRWTHLYAKGRTQCIIFMRIVFVFSVLIILTMFMLIEMMAIFTTENGEAKELRQGK